MIRDTRATFPCKSSFLNCEKDTETILRKLFVESKPYSDTLKRLLVVNTKDCLSNKDSKVIDNAVAAMTLPELVQKGYITQVPKMRMPEHEEIKSYIIISFDNFTPNENNTWYRDGTINFDIISHLDYWDIGDYQIRPLKIAGYIDGILNNCKLSGIGTLNFIGCNELILGEDLGGYTLTYRAVHGYDDRTEPQE